MQPGVEGTRTGGWEQTEARGVCSPEVPWLSLPASGFPVCFPHTPAPSPIYEICTDHLQLCWPFTSAPAANQLPPGCLLARALERELSWSLASQWGCLRGVTDCMLCPWHSWWGSNAQCGGMRRGAWGLLSQKTTDEVAQKQYSSPRTALEAGVSEQVSGRFGVW